MRRWIVISALMLTVLGVAQQVPVGTYLYAKPEGLEKYTGSLTLRFDSPGPQRLVLAYGRQHRKDRAERKGTEEAQRELYKPYKAELADGGKAAQFPHLPPDYYDIVVIDLQRMTIHEGLDLLEGENPSLTKGQDFDEVKNSLSPSKDRIGGWEAFFETKQFERCESDGERASMFVQQMRKGEALAESGARIEGCIHSIDICWVMKTTDPDKLWQVLNRQQLFREEMGTRDFFRHRFLKELQGLRVGSAAKSFTVHLPAEGKGKE